VGPGAAVESRQSYQAVVFEHTNSVLIIVRSWFINSILRTFSTSVDFSQLNNSRLLKKQCHECTQIIAAILWDVT